jgi:hypothetical protein
MNRTQHPLDLIYSVGTQVVSKVPIVGASGRMAHPAGAVGVVVQSPVDLEHSYRVRFPDGFESALRRDEVIMLAYYRRGELDEPGGVLASQRLFDRVILKVIIGSRAYGLETKESDTDYRGVYLPPAELEWSLFGVPEQLENDATQQCYWELQKFVTLALKANPNVFECLYSPLVEHATPLGRELLAMRESFLSRVAYQTFNGYVLSQFKKLQADLRNHGAVKWKHVMHLIRLLLSGICTLRHGYVPVRVEEHREQLLAIKRGEIAWPDVEAWRLNLHREFDAALSETKLPERPDYERANAFLIAARRRALEEELP